MRSKAAHPGGGADKRRLGNHRANPRRDSGDRLAGRDVPRHDGAGAHDRAFADPDAAEDDRTRAEARSVLDDRLQQLPVVAGLEAALVRRRAWELVVDEHDAVADEDLVADLDSVAHEGVALHLAALADRRAALDLHERADARLVADPAAVEVRERPDDDAVAERDVVDQPVRSVVDGCVSHGRTRRWHHTPSPAAIR